MAGRTFTESNQKGPLFNDCVTKNPASIIATAVVSDAWYGINAGTKGQRSKRYFR
jgi:hypothetical protein